MTEKGLRNSGTPEEFQEKLAEITDKDGKNGSVCF